jgi:uncharacterized OB-fold protein
VTDYAKPLPDPQAPATAAFWQAARAARLVVQKCANCGYLRWPPGPACPQCLSPEGDWTQVRASGTLLTYCVYRRAFSPAFAADVPYAVGYVQLDDGPRLYGTMVGELDALEVGLPVSAVFDPVTPEVTLVHWAISSSADPARVAGEQKEESVTRS